MTLIDIVDPPPAASSARKASSNPWGRSTHAPRYR
jgi:hypothetical protein